VAVVLGLAVAISYGAADFLGGLTSKRNPASAVVATSQACSLVLLALILLITRPDLAGTRDLLLGAAAGGAGLIGLVLLYRGLAVGAMGVIAPVTGVGAAVLPVGWGLLQGERPSTWALVGTVAAVVAVVLVAGGGGSDPLVAAARVPGKELALAVVAGVSFGVVFILLGETGEDSGIWPLVSARLVQVLILAPFLLITGAPALVAPGSRLTALAVGVLDVSANGLFLLAVREGLLSLVAVLSALYPATTVVLARAVLGERMERAQVAGLGLALLGVGLIAAG
jgi:drug/metabolite transporter (DMT)-like permease